MELELSFCPHTLKLKGTIKINNKGELIMKNFLSYHLKENASMQEKTVEELLEDMLIPSNDMKDIIKRNLYEDEGVRNTISSIFQWNCGGLNWKAKNNNFLTLVQFCANKQKDSICLTDEDAGYLRSTFVLLLEHLPEREAIKLNNRIKSLKKSDFNPSDFYSIFIEHWKDLKDWSVTYRTLYALTSIAGSFQEDAETKFQLLEILLRISDEWETSDIQG